jgi:dephospho-CoA kinase
MGELRIGLTGGLAAGKSTVGRWLEEAGFPVMDADEVVAELYTAGASGAVLVQNLFGETFILGDGSVNRSRLAELVFSDSEARLRLEAVIHPLVRDRFETHAAKHSVAILEATLLVESGLDTECDLVITVEADPALRLQRAVDRGMDEEEAKRRLEAQGSGAERRAAAHRILWNNGSPDELRSQVDELIDQLNRGDEG